MKRIAWFLLLLIAALAAFLLITIWYAAIENESMSNMMSQMMGSQNLNGMGSPTMSPYIWASLVAAIGVVIVGGFGFVYYILFPEISISRQPNSDGMIAPSQTVTESNNAKTSSPVEDGLSTLMRASKPDERKVLEVLVTRGGKCLQKTIVKESGLSRLKVHRIVSRFAERGIVSVSESGNTNEVGLSQWLNQTDSTTNKHEN
ncbi:MAG: hypothetical protein JRN20_21605 [Nitrososphaerota archaeon]|nr:hypothetical protein [Nitrososphaerota archaeon]